MAEAGSSQLPLRTSFRRSTWLNIPQGCGSSYTYYSEYEVIVSVIRDDRNSDFFFIRVALWWAQCTLIGSGNDDT